MNNKNNIFKFKIYICLQLKQFSLYKKMDKKPLLNINNNYMNMIKK